MTRIVIGELLFRSLINGEIKFENARELNDFATAYTLMLEKRLTRLDSIPEFDEQLTLIFLCKLTWPGKSRRYREEVTKYLIKFKGISTNENLQTRFRKSITIYYTSLEFIPQTIDKVSDVFYEA